MENRFNHLPPEENPGWGAYATPPPIPGQKSKPTGETQGRVPAAPQALCLQVREKLPLLLENDGDIRPEIASALYGHLATCGACAQEFDAMQRVLTLLERLDEPEMPMDFSAPILQRIQAESVLRPFPAASSASSESVSDGRAHERRESEQAVVAAHETRETALTVEEEALAGIRNAERMTVATLLAAALAFFVLTDWGRQMLGANLASVQAWLGQVGRALANLPFFGGLFAAILSALAAVGEQLGSAFRALGPMAAQGLALDAGLAACGYYFLVARRQRGPLQGSN